MTPTFNLANAAPTGDTVRPPQPNARDGCPARPGLGRRPDRRPAGAGHLFRVLHLHVFERHRVGREPEFRLFHRGRRIYPAGDASSARSSTRRVTTSTCPTRRPTPARRRGTPPGSRRTTWTLRQRRAARRRQPAVALERARSHPTVNPTGGGATGGDLAAGTYFVFYTFVYPDSTESFPSPSSANFTVTAGKIPQVTLPPLAAGASAYNLYLSNSSAAAGSAVSYVTGITTPLVNLASRSAVGRNRPAGDSEPDGCPDCQPHGGSPLRRQADGRHVLRVLHVHLSERRRIAAEPGLGAVHGGGGNTSRWSPCRRFPSARRASTSICLTPRVRRARPSATPPGSTTTTFTLPYDAPVNGADRPVNPIATVAATVNATGGGTTGGNLAPGTYYVFYTFNYQGSAYPVGVESAPSPSSLPFTVTAGDIPQVSLPLLPGRGAAGQCAQLQHLPVRFVGRPEHGDPLRHRAHRHGLQLCAAAITPARPGRRSPTSRRSFPRSPRRAAGRPAATSHRARIMCFTRSRIRTAPSRCPAQLRPRSRCRPGTSRKSRCRRLPAGSIGYNIYLSNATATAGSATRYASDITTSTYDLQNATPRRGVSRSLNPAATVAPTVLPTGGGTTGGNLAPGTYYVLYTFIYPSGAESFGSPASSPFTVSAGNIPEVCFRRCRTVRRVTTFTCPIPSADPGSAVRYASTVTIVHLLPARRRAGRRPESCPRPTSPSSRADTSTRSAVGRPAANCCRVTTTSSIRSLTRTAPSRSPARSRRISPWRRATSRRSRSPRFADRRDSVQHLPLRRRGECWLVDAVCLRCHVDALTI